MPSSQFDLLSGFIQTSIPVKNATKHLKDDAVVVFELEGDAESYHFIPKQGNPTLHKGVPAQRDIDLYFTRGALDRLTAYQGGSLGELGVLFLQLLASKDSGVDVQIRTIHSGFLTFARKGYFTVVAKAGPAVLTFLAKKGLGNPAGLKRAIDKYRGRA